MLLDKGSDDTSSPKTTPSKRGNKNSTLTPTHVNTRSSCSVFVPVALEPRKSVLPGSRRSSADENVPILTRIEVSMLTKKEIVPALKARHASCDPNATLESMKKTLVSVEAERRKLKADGLPPVLPPRGRFSVPRPTSSLLDEDEDHGGKEEDEKVGEDLLPLMVDIEKSEVDHKDQEKQAEDEMFHARASCLSPLVTDIPVPFAASLEDAEESPRAVPKKRSRSSFAALVRKASKEHRLDTQGPLFEQRLRRLRQADVSDSKLVLLQSVLVVVACALAVWVCERAWQVGEDVWNIQHPDGCLEKGVQPRIFMADELVVWLEVLIVLVSLGSLAVYYKIQRNLIALYYPDIVFPWYSFPQPFSRSLYCLPFLLLCPPHPSMPPVLAVITFIRCISLFQLCKFHPAVRTLRDTQISTGTPPTFSSLYYLKTLIRTQTLTAIAIITSICITPTIFAYQNTERSNGECGVDHSLMDTTWSLAYAVIANQAVEPSTPSRAVAIVAAITTICLNTMFFTGLLGSLELDSGQNAALSVALQKKVKADCEHAAATVIKRVFRQWRCRCTAHSLAVKESLAEFKRLKEEALEFEQEQEKAPLDVATVISDLKMKVEEQRASLRNVMALVEGKSSHVLTHNETLHKTLQKILKEHIKDVLTYQQTVLAHTLESQNTMGRARTEHSEALYAATTRNMQQLHQLTVTLRAELAETQAAHSRQLQTMQAEMQSRQDEMHAWHEKTVAEAARRQEEDTKALREGQAELRAALKDLSASLRVVMQENHALTSAEFAKAHSEQAQNVDNLKLQLQEGLQALHSSHDATHKETLKDISLSRTQQERGIETLQATLAEHQKQSQQGFQTQHNVLADLNKDAAAQRTLLQTQQAEALVAFQTGQAALCSQLQEGFQAQLVHQDNLHKQTQHQCASLQEKAVQSLKEHSQAGLESHYNRREEIHKDSQQQLLLLKDLQEQCAQRLQEELKAQTQQSTETQQEAHKDTLQQLALLRSKQEGSLQVLQDAIAETRGHIAQTLQTQHADIRKDVDKQRTDVLGQLEQDTQHVRAGQVEGLQKLQQALQAQSNRWAELHAETQQLLAALQKQQDEQSQVVQTVQAAMRTELNQALQSQRTRTEELHVEALKQLAAQSLDSQRLEEIHKDTITHFAKIQSQQAALHLLTEREFAGAFAEQEERHSAGLEALTNIQARLGSGESKSGVAARSSLPGDRDRGSQQLDSPDWRAELRAAVRAAVRAVHNAAFLEGVEAGAAMQPPALHPLELSSGVYEDEIDVVSRKPSQNESAIRSAVPRDSSPSRH